MTIHFLNSNFTSSPLLFADDFVRQVVRTRCHSHIEMLQLLRHLEQYWMLELSKLWSINVFGPYHIPSELESSANDVTGKACCDGGTLHSSAVRFCGSGMPSQSSTQVNTMSDDSLAAAELRFPILPACTDEWRISSADPSTILGLPVPTPQTGDTQLDIDLYVV